VLSKNFSTLKKPQKIQSGVSPPWRDKLHRTHAFLTPTSWQILEYGHEINTSNSIQVLVSVALLALFSNGNIFKVLSAFFVLPQENPGLIVPWIIGYITFMALEAVAMVYSNVLRDHVNKVSAPPSYPRIARVKCF